MSDKRYVFKKLCGTCPHLIFKDYEHHEGRCSISGCNKHFETLCDYSHNIERDRRLNNGTTT